MVRSMACASRIAHRAQGTRDINKIIIKIKEEERERERERERGREKEKEEGYTLSVEHRTSYIAHCT